MKPDLLELINIYKDHNLFKFFDDFRQDLRSIKLSTITTSDKSCEILEKIISGNKDEKEDVLQDLEYFTNELSSKYHDSLEKMWNFFNNPNYTPKEEVSDMLKECARISDEDIDITKNIVIDYLKQESQSYIKRTELLKPISANHAMEKPSSTTFLISNNSAFELWNKKSSVSK